MNTNLKRGAIKPPFFYSYLITDPKEYGTDPETFEKKLTQVLQQHQVDMLCFRDKTTKDRAPLAKICLEVAKDFHISKVLINSDLTLALKLGFDGIHLTASQFDLIDRSKEANLFTMISCHNEQEISLAKIKKVDGVTFSPIYYKENKDTPKGCESLQKIVEKYKEEDFLIIALGGITDKKRVDEVQKTICDGFASIGYFTHNL